MKTAKLHMIGNAHIDPVWLWQWQEGFHEVKATFRSALDRMKEYDDFVFTASSAALYEWVEQSDPAMFAEIQQRVKEGRWSIVGGWWIEPDCNIPNGESFARQALYGQRYFKEKFGVTARVGYAIDSFGHHGMLPQLLRKSGLTSYVFLRPMPFEKALPGGLFWWESDDGSRVMGLRVPFEYLSWGREVDEHVRRCAGEIKDPVNEFVCFYGVGNHGGGPTKENIESIRRLNNVSDLPNLEFSSLDRFFDAAVEKGWSLPVVHTDLQHHASGCYAAHSGIKRWNRKAENRLAVAEKWSTIASLVTGQSYPANLAQAWKDVLFNQFHDIMAGTSLEVAYDDARDHFGEALTIADRAANLAMQSFEWNIRIDPAEAMYPLVVFNPLAFPVRTTVKVEAIPWRDDSFLLDDTGKVVPHQSMQSSSVAGRICLTFPVELPAMGYRTNRFYMVPPQGDAHQPIRTTSVQAADTLLENDRFRLEFDPETGSIASLFDKSVGVQAFAGLAAHPVVLEDNTDTWSHLTFKWDKVVGEFKAESIRLVEHGPVKSVVRITSTYESSRLIQDFTIYADLERIDVSAIVNWNEQFKMLKLRFPVNVKFMRVTREIPYGHIDCFANGEEEPMQRWVDVSGTSRDKEAQYGVSILNDGKYSMDVNVRDIGLTVLRSPAYANHMPSTLDPGGLYSFFDHCKIPIAHQQLRQDGVIHDVHHPYPG
ncbi:MAG TPA: glycoside hydrolase family 38 C-terminal domain-containing protein, partial [Anaerolineaceae bacterium]|nr:glycoside hydrolase family 38 C-terminal domain-containing protein [Anaerolineaceae bacterium]